MPADCVLSLETGFTQDQNTTTINHTMKHQTQLKVIAAFVAIQTQFTLEQVAKGKKGIQYTNDTIQDAIDFLKMELEPDKIPNTNSLEVTVAEGKYTVILPESGGLHALRYGEKWRNCYGDNLILALASELQEARKALVSVNTKCPRCKLDFNICNEKSNHHT